MRGLIKVELLMNWIEKEGVYASHHDLELILRVWGDCRKLVQPRNVREVSGKEKCRKEISPGRYCRETRVPLSSLIIWPSQSGGDELWWWDGVGEKWGESRISIDLWIYEIPSSHPKASLFPDFPTMVPIVPNYILGWIHWNPRLIDSSSKITYLEIESNWAARRNSASKNLCEMKFYLPWRKSRQAGIKSSTE